MKREVGADRSENQVWRLRFVARRHWSFRGLDRTSSRSEYEQLQPRIGNAGNVVGDRQHNAL
jgi:hypothetical protein